ncbi:MAG: hypothetical protein GY737_10455 [Desulfobacteraceae bacterium]|nr:hypothetical protein [Desulfobacteraceae bacterium]
MTWFGQYIDRSGKFSYNHASNEKLKEKYVRNMNDMKAPNRIKACGLNAVLTVIVLWIMGLLALHSIVPGHSGNGCSESTLQAAIGMDDGDESEEFHAALPPLEFPDAVSPVVTGFLDCPQKMRFQPFEAGSFHLANAPPTRIPDLLCSIEKCDTAPDGNSVIRYPVLCSVALAAMDCRGSFTANG